MMTNIAGINKQQAVLQEFSDLAWYPPCIKKLFHFFHILFGIKPNLLLRNYFQIQYHNKLHVYVHVSLWFSPLYIQEIYTVM